MKKDCPFCAISKEPRILKEGKYMYVILSNPRLMPGHLLVISKRHVARLSELREEERKELLDLLIEFEERILARLSSGCDIRQNYKPYVPNSRTSVEHFHFHLYPRNLDDQIHEAIDPHQKPLYRDLSEEERKRLSALFME
ncbi:MAG: HIT domain-containing protein [Patescibacteria group bacterium]